MADDDPGPGPTDVVSCATGILMERYGWTADDAGARLVDWSRRTEVGVLDISVWLMEDAAGHRPEAAGLPADPAPGPLEVS